MKKKFVIILIVFFLISLSMVFAYNVITDDEGFTQYQQFEGIFRKEDFDKDFNKVSSEFNKKFYSRYIYFDFNVDLVDGSVDYEIKIRMWSKQRDKYEILYKQKVFNEQGYWNVIF